MIESNKIRYTDETGIQIEGRLETKDHAEEFDSPAMIEVLECDVQFDIDLTKHSLQDVIDTYKALVAEIEQDYGVQL